MKNNRAVVIDDRQNAFPPSSLIHFEIIQTLKRNKLEMINFSTLCFHSFLYESNLRFCNNTRINYPWEVRHVTNCWRMKWINISWPYNVYTKLFPFKCVCKYNNNILTSSKPTICKNQSSVHWLINILVQPVASRYVRGESMLF